MGTSASSNGPGHGVSFDPPWLDNIVIQLPSSTSQQDPAVTDNEDAHEPVQTDDEDNQDTVFSSPDLISLDAGSVAPPSRFGSARRALGKFAESGRADSFRKAAGHYSRKGMGGAHNLAKRMRVASTTGASAFAFLQAAREGTNRSINEWVLSLMQRNATVQEIANEIVQKVVPQGGSKDEVSSQDPMAQALQDFLAEYETVDLLHLSDDYIWMIIESFIGYEAFSRMCLDIGQVFEKSKLSPRNRVERMNEMHNFLKADMCRQIEDLRANTRNAMPNQLQNILNNAIENTFAVYEGVI